MSEGLSFSIEREDWNHRCVVKVVLNDHDLARNHLVPLRTDDPVEAIAAYVLHCMKIIDEVRQDRAFEEYHRIGWREREANRFAMADRLKDSASQLADASPKSNPRGQ